MLYVKPKILVSSLYSLKEYLLESVSSFENF